jgi:hypothetical protein
MNNQLQARRAFLTARSRALALEWEAANDTERRLIEAEQHDLRAEMVSLSRRMASIHIARRSADLVTK